MDHIVIYETEQKEILRIKNGEKTALIRAANSRKLPHGLVREGDRLFFAVNDRIKNISRIVLKGEAGEVNSTQRLSEKESEEFLHEKQQEYNFTNEEVEKHMGKAFISLVKIKNVEGLDPTLNLNVYSIDVSKDWITIDNIADYIT